MGRPVGDALITFLLAAGWLQIFGEFQDRGSFEFVSVGPEFGHNRTYILVWNGRLLSKTSLLIVESSYGITGDEVGHFSSFSGIHSVPFFFFGSYCKYPGLITHIFQ
jgi:hypothetical protein